MHSEEPNSSPHVWETGALAAKPTSQPCFILCLDKTLCFQLLALPCQFKGFFGGLPSNKQISHITYSFKPACPTKNSSYIDDKKSQVRRIISAHHPAALHASPTTQGTSWKCSHSLGFTPLCLTSLIRYTGIRVLDLRSLDPLSLLVLKLRTLFADIWITVLFLWPTCHTRPVARWLLE